MLRLCLLAALTLAAQADGLVTEVKVRQSRDAVQIVLPASGAVRHRARTLDKSVVVDLFPAKLGSVVKDNYAVNCGLISKVNVRQLGDSTVRVTLSATSAPSYKRTERPGSRGLVLEIGQGLPVPPRKKLLGDKLVTLSLVNADLNYAIKVLAKELNCNLHIQSGLAGTVNVQLNGVPAELALAEILRAQEGEATYKYIEAGQPISADQFTWLPIAKSTESGNTRQTVSQQRYAVLLERKPETETPDSQYKGVTFCRERFPWSRSEDEAGLETASLMVNYIGLSEIKTLIESILPNVICTMDPENQTLTVEGSPANIEQAKEILYELDRPSADHP